MSASALVSRLHAEGLTFAQIVKVTGLPRPAVMDALQALGITKRSLPRVEQLTPWAEAVFFGTMLGDGHLRSRHTGGIPHLSLSHSLKQRAYLEWKVMQLDELFLAAAPSEQVDSDGHASVHVTSRAMSLLQPYYDLFYTDGKKRVTQALLERVARHDFFDAVLAVWFGDDGYRSSGNGKSLGFCFGGLDESTYVLMADWLQAHGFDGRLHQHMGRSSYCYYLMRVSAAHRFRDVILPYLPDCMHYKLDIGPPRKIRRSRSTGPVAAVSGRSEV